MFKMNMNIERTGMSLEKLQVITVEDDGHFRTSA